MIETKYQPLPEKICENYFTILINRIYKILPLKEEHSPTVDVYIESLSNELTGGTNVIEEFNNDGMFLSILFALEYLINCSEIPNCKREVFRCIKIVENLKDKYYKDKGGD